MRLSVALALALAACTDPSATAPAAGASPEALGLLEHVGPEAVAAAFDALDAVPYTASVGVTVTGPDGGTLGTEAATVRSRDGAVEVTDRSRAGGVAGAEGAPRLHDPVGPTLPDDPPYLDPASRDQYRIAVAGDTVVAGQRLRLVEAVFVAGRRAQPVRRVRAAVDPASGQPVVVEVVRVTESTLYDETSRIHVDLARLGDRWIPHRVTTDTRTDVPLAPARRVQTEWTVVEAGGQRLQPVETARR